MSIGDIDKYAHPYTSTSKDDNGLTQGSSSSGGTERADSDDDSIIFNPGVINMNNND